MFFYYIKLALLSYRRNPVLSSLMVLAIAVGIGAFMVVYTLTYIMGGDPIPQKSDQLYHIQFDYGDPAISAFEPPPQLTYRDAMAMLEAPFDYPRTATSRFSEAIEPPSRNIAPFFANGRGALSDFFTMFDVPFLYGGPWGAESDSNGEQGVVLSRDMNDRLFGGENSVGKNLDLGSLVFTIVGVLDEWQPIPKFYDLNNGQFNVSEEVYVPWHLIASQELRRSGNTNCWAPPEGDEFQAFLNAECAWIQYWVQLPDQNAFNEYQSFLNSYVEEQRAFGRMRVPVDKRLFNVIEWMEEQEALPNEIKVLTVLAGLLLAVCLLNTVGLLLAKFLGKSAELGVRQALGANKSSLMIQHTIETGVLGTIGGLLGLGFALLGMEGVKILLSGDIPIDWLGIDMTMAMTTVGLAIISGVFAGLYPIWRTSRINPAIHLKTQ